MTTRDDWYANLADRARTFGDERYSQAEAMARQYGAMLADWDRLRADVTETYDGLRATAEAFTEAEQLADATRVWAVASSYQAVLRRMNELRP